MPAADLSPLTCVRRAPAAPFDEVFGVRAADDLASMDAAGDDVVNQPPGCGIEIGAVGLRRRDVVVAIRDPFGSPADVNAVRTLDVAAGEDAGARMPLMTHSQRCATTVTAGGVTRDVPPAELLARLDRVLWRTCNTLPRDADLLCVQRAHRSPQFIEDALRVAAAAPAEAWSAPASFRCIVGRSRSLESIHEHDLTASLRLRPSDLR